MYIKQRTVMKDQSCAVGTDDLHIRGSDVEDWVTNIIAIIPSAYGVTERWQ